MISFAAFTQPLPTCAGHGTAVPSAVRLRAAAAADASWAGAATDAKRDMNVTGSPPRGAPV